MSNPVREYTDAERAFLRAAWGKVKATAIARKLGRSVMSVYLKARRMGLRARPPYDSQQRKRIVALWKRGWLDTEIARLLGVSTAGVARFLRNRGCAAHYRVGMPVPDRLRKRLRAATKRRLMAEGVQSLSEYVQCARGRQAAEMGWPEARTVTEARVLAAVEQEPDSVEELARLAGLKRPHASNVLACLLRRGLLVRLSAHRLGRYRLAPWLAERHTQCGSGEQAITKLRGVVGV